MIETSLLPVYTQLFRGLLMGAVMVDDDHEVLQSTIDVGSKNSKETVNVVNLKGMMTRHDGECHYGTRTIAKKLKEADAEKSVIGHIIFIDSGGGAANSVPDLAEAIEALTKPCVAFVDGMMASAAIYVGSYCDYIIANREDDMIGCVGTMIQIIDYPKSGELSSGEICVRVYADGSEEKNLDYEEALQGNIQMIKDEVLNPLNAKFVQAMKENRHLNDETLLKGKTYFAKDVVGTLIDEIGEFKKAIDKVISLSKSKINSETQNISNMFDNLKTIQSCSVIEETPDKTVTLSTEQLTDIDTEFGNIKKQLFQAQESITTLNDSLNKKENRIKELEKAMEEVGNKTVVDDKFPQGNSDDDSLDYSEKDSLTYCTNYLKQFSK
ncbi:MAG: S49 family peptidase [Bacteroidales bacterium]|nr:S49 family peptidase [Bacteroidales bacterium]